ncbi:MAG: hypothetical protein GC179_26275 [Anaerolineaceae bacterium]|nr:hypothetical protein [Anaerolineaceae bacterium]
MAEAQDYATIRRRVEARFRQRYGFYAHLAAYTLVNLVLWLIWGLTSGMAWQLSERFQILGGLSTFLTMPWPLIVMAGWGIGLVAHGLNYYIRYGDGAIRRQAAINREVEREMSQYVRYEKPKNDSQMRLTDDGELEVMEDETDWPQKRKQQ